MSNDITNQVDPIGRPVNTTTTSGSRPQRKSLEPEEILMKIGFPDKGPSFVLGEMFSADPQPTLEGIHPLDSHPCKEDITRRFPKRQTVDFLVQYFLDEVNWLYEEISSQTFLESYTAWWSQETFQGAHDIQFGILILRLCVKSLQFMPSDVPTTNRLEGSLDSLEYEFNAAAKALDDFHNPRRTSLIRVQQLLIYVPTLISSSNVDESYRILGEAVNEARSIGLFLEEKWFGVSEFDKEVRRKTFWSLYVWDRFCSTFLGKWPLIPDLWFDVKLPLERVYSTTSDPTVPTHFTDVLLSIKICQFMHSFISAPAKKSERLDPNAVATHAERFQREFVATLPPAFRLIDPDTKWDAMIPCLSRKRAAVHIMVWGVVESMHKGFMGPLTPALGQTSREYDSTALHKQQLAKNHRMTFVWACIKGLEATFNLYKLMGGDAPKYFFLPMGTIEATVGLGIAMISDAVATRQKKARAFDFEPEMREKAYQTIEQSIEMLDVIAQRSAMAQKGLTLLRKLKWIWQAEKLGGCSLFPSLPGDAYVLPDDKRQKRDMVPNANTTHQQDGYLGQLEYAMSPQDIQFLDEWAEGGDMSRFFHDDLFTDEFENLPIDI